MSDNITMSRTQFRALLVEVVEVGVTKALTETGSLKQTLSKSEAYRKYSRGRVEDWIKNKLIEPKRDRSGCFKYNLDRLELDILSKADNRAKFIYTED